MTDIGVVNIASHLKTIARSRPFAPAVFCPSGRDRSGRTRYVHWTYQQLDAESDRIAKGLGSNGVGRGVRTVLMVKPSLEFFSLTFALFKLGAVPILIDPGMGIKNLGRCLDEAQPVAFIGIPRAQVARRLLGWGRATLQFTLTVGRELTYQRIERSVKRRFDPREWLPRAGIELGGAMDVLWDPGHDEESVEIAPTRPDETAAILFTSGSTGPPKGAVYTHAIFAAQVELLRNLYGIEPGEIDLCTFPLFALFAPALGMTAVIPEMDATRPAHVDPNKILEPIESFGVTNLFGSPALLKRVGGFGAERGITLPSLRRVVSAGAPVPARVIETFAKMLMNDAEIHTPYGATEALPVASINSRAILGETRQATDRGAGVCVGRPVEGMRVAIIRITDAAIPNWSDDLELPDGQIGEIAVQGPVATREYFKRPAATALAKIAGPNGGFWHRMGDLGYRDDPGRIWFCGRKAHRVITPAGTLFTIPCEAVFNTHPAVSRAALVGVGTPGKMKPVLCVELARPRVTDDLQRLRTELLEIGARFPHTREIRTILFHPSFPVDIRHNAKIFREKLAIWAARKLR
ncbi:MAG: fatty acid CoA ligase family protein [Isosphaeraceae bacterium]|nr:fatty acid CoA ligase family protein [Isosphaeraceae bacterium]